MPLSRSRDLRAYARSTQLRLILGGLALLFLVGDGLVWAVYGPNAALLAVLCGVIGLMPILLIAAGLWFLDAIARKSRGD